MAEVKHGSISVHVHGDGSFHSFSPARSEGSGFYGGEKEPGRVEHPSIGHLLMHIASKHAPDDHFHVHAHEDGFTTHHVHEGGKVSGPHEHESLTGVKRQLSEFNEQGLED